MNRFPTRPRRAFTLIELLVVIAIIGVLIALLLPAVQACRSAARRMNCVSNMMQAAIGMANYESAFEVYPPGVVNASGPISNTNAGYHQGWLVQILPFMEQKNVFNSMNFKLGVYTEANHTVRSFLIATYLCPADPEARTPSNDGSAQTSFYGSYHDVEAPIAANNNGVLFLNSAVRTEDIEDGAAQTISFGEAKVEAESLGWPSGTRWSLRNMGTVINGAPLLKTPALPDPVGGYSSYHPGGANFAFCDGSVRFLRNSTAASVLKTLANRKDGAMIGANAY